MLPSGWEKQAIGKLCQSIVPGRNKPKSFDGHIPWITTPEIQGRYIPSKVQKNYVSFDAIKESGAKIVPIGSVIISAVGELGLTAIAKEEIVLNQQLHAFVCPDYICNEYLAYWLGTQKYYMDSVASKTTIPYMNKANCESIPVAYPPLPEQQKIAQILSTWDKAIEKLEALIAAKQKRKKALMQQLLTGNKRFAEFVKSEGIQKTKFGTMPSDWQYMHISDVAKQLSVKNNAGHNLPVLSCTKHYGLVDSLVYFGKQIFSEDTSTYKVVLRNSFAYATNHIEEGSIGYQNLYDKALISPMYTVFQTKENINDEFLYRLLKTELYRHIFEVNTSASVDRRGSLRWDQFSAIKIPVPSIPEQQKIASFFAVTDKEIQTHQNQLAALKQQKKGLMQQLLTGKKRVKVHGHV